MPTKAKATSARPAGWIFKTDPETYSIDDLEREKQTVWDGVTNPQAVRAIREMRPGDRVFVLPPSVPAERAVLAANLETAINAIAATAANTADARPITPALGRCAAPAP